jgi:hypothetical protein
MRSSATAPEATVGAFCADQTFWQLLVEGPVAVWFDDRIEAHAIIEAYSEARDET